MIKLKKIINIHVFKILISVLCIFSAGILMQSEFIFALLLFICGYILQIDDYVKNLENFNKKIDGFGISKISVSDKEPISPKEEELWIHTTEEK